MPKKPTLQEVKDRFMSKVQKGESCWDWQGQKLPKGYGQFFIPKPFRPAKSTIITAHRAAYILFVGEIQPGAVICHRCDNPSCVNPAHLFAGSNTDNMRDCAVKGRINTAKLSSADVLAIRASNDECLELAAAYQVSAATINAVKRGVTHVDIGGRVVDSLRKISIETGEEILAATGRQVDIAKQFGVSQATVSAIKRGVFFGERRAKKRINQ